VNSTADPVQFSSVEMKSDEMRLAYEMSDETLFKATVRHATVTNGGFTPK